MANMGIGFASQVLFKRQNRFIMYIPGITHTLTGQRAISKALVEEKSARPNISFKEVEVPHLIETIYFAGRPDWKPLKVTLYDVANGNPAWDWIRSLYGVYHIEDFNTGGRSSSNSNISVQYKGSLNATSLAGGSLDESQTFKRTIQIFMLDGCGNAIEAWTYMHAFPTDVEFGETDMTGNDVMKVNLTLRYDRAYWESCSDEMNALVQSYMFT
jgi:hypothetical protein